MPKLRFKGFTDDWEQRKFDEGVTEIGDGLHGTPIYSDEGDTYFVNGNNLVNGQIVIDDDTKTVDACQRSVADKELDDTTILMSINGTIGNLAYYSGEKLMLGKSAAYIKVSDYDKKFIYAYLQAPLVQRYFKDNLTGTTIKNLGLKAIREMNLFVPQDGEEQEKIGRCFYTLDNLIALHQRKCDELQKVKKYMLQKMFPKKGEKVPEIRLAGFTGDWEQRKFSDLVDIERGGSPRPIDKFITQNSNGLNWVKIGDAPAQGNYITKTAEKIRPEGLSKTREVHPGDLILSNSMSFGKPYIMGIDGCIHDGWLLIRNSKSVFDLKFLCVLLGTENMLSQYKAMAAGSTVNNLNKELVGGTTVVYPKIEEQRKIGMYISNLDNLIALHQRKHETLKEIKKYMLQNMFPKK